ncbi:hypothetical protein [Mesonia aquimarina]|uniref:hypothetical protein n=1 Tax=Mesonia aquimarina TaxID=1504967 RepID=UPI000EF5ED4E|nr:hypothetical protein [Mesonia aquimarina]
MRKNVLVILILATLILGVTSCQPILKAVTGIRNPKFEMTQVERMEYYQPLIAENYETKITAFANWEDLQKGFNIANASGYPNLFIKNLETQKIYRLDCYEDLEENIEEINQQDYSYVEEKQEETEYFYKIDSLSSNSTEVVYHNLPIQPTKEKTWDVIILSGTFLGKKLRKRTLPIKNLENISSLKIIDLSINIISEKS